ncbi:hypothetical protein DB30_01423 [Enhygromyxa salina]|uniref:Uncharacterized protein n=1 Tax=Enhygromyxa salina TaxID=215803 RepID=A0A0C1ZLA2_9BACT|nr:hypothetical protein [Enhygromyxa salina]KIG18314.1 hypothetical protein DB30_01423 [Enhygromyxa salina]
MTPPARPRAVAELLTAAEIRELTERSDARHHAHTNEPDDPERHHGCDRLRPARFWPGRADQPRAGFAAWVGLI